MDQLNFHKQKLYCLVIAGVALISLLLPWVSVNFGPFGSATANGFRDTGILSFVGILGVAAACLLGDKTLPFDDQNKKIALGSFGAILLGALIFFLRATFNGGISALGFGLWLTIISGAVGLAWVLGKVNLPDIRKKP
ncbi:MAG: hypothetical protein ABW007_06535 [Chitinophagaceae bacterium]